MKYDFSLVLDIPIGRRSQSFVMPPRALLVWDFDGTLAPEVDDPLEARALPAAFAKPSQKLPSMTPHRLAQRQADQRGAGIQQGGRGKRTQPPAEVLHQRRAQAKQQRRQQGQKTATQGG